jgi:hypothetical protein
VVNMHDDRCNIRSISNNPGRTNDTNPAQQQSWAGGRTGTWPSSWMVGIRSGTRNSSTS